MKKLSLYTLRRHIALREVISVTLLIRHMACFTPAKRVTRYPLNTRLGTFQSRSGRNGEVKNLVSLLIARCEAFRGQFSKANLH